MGAATNDLSGLLQKGLFEEEANRNLEAAAQAYSTVSAQFDKDRKLAATAIFRLGEIYRKQGKTNEAAGQYERIVREFADQDTLVTLSRQNLVGMGSLVTITGLQKTLADEQEVGRLAAQLGGIEKLKDNPEEQARAVLAFFPDDTLKQMLLNLPKLKEQDDLLRANLQADSKTQFLKVRDKLGEWRTALGPKGFEPGAHSTNLVWDAEWELKKQFAWIKERVDFNVGVQKASLQALQAAAGMPDREGGVSEKSALATDDEEKEIRRIQEMIKNSPDLINVSDGAESQLGNAASRGWLRVASFLLDSRANINVRFNGVGPTPLHNAVQFGNKAMVELLLQRGADVNARDGTGGTALHLAAQSGFLSIAEVLVKYKADLNARNSKANGEQSPLHLAAKNGNAALVGFLLANGDDANRRDAAGQTPLHFGVSLGRDGVVERLLNSGADVNATDTAGETPLMEAAQAGHSVSVKALLAAKAKPELLEEKGRTALSYAAEKGDAACVNALLAAKADPNASRYNLPLHIAIHGNSPAIVEALLRADADANRVAAISYQERNGNKTAFECNPLYLAVSENNPEAVKLLLHFKADPNGIGSTKEPVIFRAVGNIPILKSLLEAGADANLKDLNGATVLMRTVGNADAVKLLLDHSAQVDTRDKSQMTALLLAAEARNLKSAELLLAAKADVNAQHSYGFTPLHYGVVAGQKQLVELLLANGADPNIRDSSGMTPLDYAKLKPGIGIPATVSFAQARGETPAKPEELAALLRQHGAVDDLPNLDRIEVRRPEERFAMTVFGKGTNDWNQFTLVEAILNVYSGARPIPQAGQPQSLSFPDLHRVVVVRPSRTPGQPSERRVVDLLSPTGEVDCAKDVALDFGDVVEIPERDHTLQDSAVGLTQNETKQMQECRSGKVGLLVKGKKTELKVWPYPTEALIGSVLTRTEARSALFSTSDLSHVKVTRPATAGGKKQEWLLDCSGGNNPDLWLRDGDVIEVPDKP